MQRVLESDNDKLTNGSLSITSFINVFGQRYNTWYLSTINLSDIHLSSIRWNISLCIGHCISIVGILIIIVSLKNPQWDIQAIYCISVSHTNWFYAMIVGLWEILCFPPLPIMTGDQGGSGIPLALRNIMCTPYFNRWMCVWMPSWRSSNHWLMEPRLFRWNHTCKMSSLKWFPRSVLCLTFYNNIIFR